MASNPYTGNYVNYNAKAAGMTPAPQSGVFPPGFNLNKSFNDARLGLDKIRIMTLTGSAGASGILDVMQVPAYGQDASGFQTDTNRTDEFGRMVPNIPPKQWQKDTLTFNGKPTVEMQFMLEKPDYAVYFETFYPGMVNEILADDPTALANYQKLVGENQGRIEEFRSMWSPGVGTDPKTTLPASTTKPAAAAGAKVDIRQQLEPGQAAPPARQTIAKIRAKAVGLTDQQRLNRVKILAQRIQDGSAKSPADAMRRINAFQTASINKAIGPMSAKNKAIFNQVRQARLQGKPVNSAQAKKAAAIKKFRQNKYIKQTGNSLFQTGFKPAAQPTTPGVGAPVGPGQIPDMGGMTVPTAKPTAPASTARPGSAPKPKPNKPNKPNNPNKPNKPKGKK